MSVAVRVAVCKHYDNEISEAIFLFVSLQFLVSEVIAKISA